MYAVKKRRKPWKVDEGRIFTADIQRFSAEIDSARALGRTPPLSLCSAQTQISNRHTISFLRHVTQVNFKVSEFPVSFYSMNARNFAPFAMV